MAITFRPEPGKIARHAGDRFLILEIKDLRQAPCRNLGSMESKLLQLADLGPDENQDLAEKKSVKQVEILSVPSEKWIEAAKAMDLISGLAAKGRYRRTVADVELVAEELGKSTKTIYRWLSRFEKITMIDAFLPKKRSDNGGSRLQKEVEEIILQAIRKQLMKQEFETFKEVHRQVKHVCLKKGYPVPSLGTIRNRFLQISEAERVASRQGVKKAKENFTPLLGSFPGADYPLAVIQIDHTPADLIIVDDVYRKPIGRPYLTVAIDVFSRVVMGFKLWLEAPSAASVGLCLFHAMLPKDKWLEEIGVNAEWNFFGRPRKIHTDNAKEFRGTVLGRACKRYNIDLEQRPKGQPQYGGHIERSFRTFLRNIHTAPGTTYSDVKSKFEYDSEGKAIMTLAEFEHWFTTYLTKKYHVDFHTGIKTTPTARYIEGIMGTDERPGIGIPERFTDPEQVRLDFLPFVERTIQEYGVLMDHIYYYDDILRSHIHEKDPENPKQARKFTFRRDPRDVSVIYFWDPDLNIYSEIHTANRGRPPVSLWEVRTVVRELHARGKSHVDERLIFEGVTEMRDAEAQSAEKTKSARRNQQRRAEAEKYRKQKSAKSSKPADVTREISASVAAQTAPLTNRAPDLFADDEEVMPFEDIGTRR